MKKVFIETYGCSNNEAESRVMAGILEKKGYSLTESEENADVVIVNTCSVKNKTENKILHRLDSLSGRKLIVAGCLPEADLQRVKSRVNTTIVGTNHIEKIDVAVDSLLDGNIVEFVGKQKVEKIGLPKISRGIIDIIPISSGCASVCSFCSTKLAKGNLFSYSQENIVNEIRNSKLGGGAREFWLTSQDCGCYGFENKTNAARLLNDITSSVSGEYFLRLGMANPQHVKRILPELIEAYKDSHVFKFLHIPVQSGSDNILRKMIRGHSAQDYVNVVEAFRRAFPQISVWTDIIVGFPGETEEDFQKSMEILEKTRPDVANISAFSSRRGTKASQMKQIATEIIKERTEKISILAEKINLENNKAWIGWQGPAIVDEFKPGKNSFIARTLSYKPIVLKHDMEIGQMVDVRITDVNDKCLFGELA